MKLLILRHGESEDDIINAYGGWADFQLTEKGKHQAQEAALKIKTLKDKFDVVLTSPLKRAYETAEIIANTNNLALKTFEYIKERNTYGLLCGMIKNEAKEKYPWLVEALETNNFVDGGERDEDIKTRVKKAFELISHLEYKNIIMVTHGVFLKSFFPEVISKKLTKKEDAGFILLDIKHSDDGKVLECKTVTMDGIEIA